MNFGCWIMPDILWTDSIHPEYIHTKHVVNIALLAIEKLKKFCIKKDGNSDQGTVYRQIIWIISDCIVPMLYLCANNMK